MVAASLDIIFVCGTVLYCIYICMSLCMPVLIEINVLLHDNGHWSCAVIWGVNLWSAEWMQLCSLSFIKLLWCIMQEFTSCTMFGVTEAACLLLLSNVDCCCICDKTSKQLPLSCCIWSAVIKSVFNFSILVCFSHIFIWLQNRLGF